MTSRPPQPRARLIGTARRGLAASAVMGVVTTAAVAGYLAVGGLVTAGTDSSGIDGSAGSTTGGSDTTEAPQSSDGTTDDQGSSGLSTVPQQGQSDGGSNAS